MGVFSYDANRFDATALATQIAATGADALFVSSYLDDGVALRRANLAAGTKLLAEIGTSSSYCHPAFGAALGADAVGLFASDKPDAAHVKADALQPDGRAALEWVTPRYKSRYGDDIERAGAVGVFWRDGHSRPRTARRQAGDRRRGSRRDRLSSLAGGITSERQWPRVCTGRRGRWRRQPGRLVGDLGVGGASDAGRGVAGGLRHVGHRAMKRVVVAGGLLAMTYVATVVATGVLTDRTVRPLFDATGPAPAYRWVKPPPDFETGNVKPKSTEIGFGLKPEDLPPAGSSEDSQFVFNLTKGGIAIQGADSRGIARIEPHDPDTLGPLPAGQFADGNAYRITFRYDPSGTPAPVTAPGSCLMTIPVPAEGILYSEDGKAWRPVVSQHASATAIGGELPGSGYYLAFSPDALNTTGGGGTARLVVPILITVAAAAALVATPLLRRRSRSR